MTPIKMKRFADVFRKLLFARRLLLRCQFIPGDAIAEPRESPEKYVEMSDGTFLGREDIPGFVAKLKAEIDGWRAKHDELGRAIFGLAPDDTAHNFDHDALCRAAERARAAFVIDVPPKIIDTRCSGCCEAVGSVLTIDSASLEAH